VNFGTLALDPNFHFLQTTSPWPFGRAALVRGTGNPQRHGHGRWAAAIGPLAGQNGTGKLTMNGLNLQAETGSVKLWHAWPNYSAATGVKCHPDR